MSKPMVRIHNLETDEIIDREMTDEEFSVFKETAKNEAKKIADEKAKADARQAIFDRLGITEEEARLLLG